MKYVCLIASHNNRIQCVLDRLNKSKKKIRFQNAAIICLTLTKTNYSIELVYSGELSDNDKRKVSESRPYYSTTERTEGYMEYVSNNDLPIEQVILSLNLKVEDINNDTYRFYIIRHGHSEHNQSINLKIAKVSSTFGMKKDTNITSTGEQQAFNAGKLVDILREREEDIQFWFCSDLVRTRQTISQFVKALGKKPNYITVLPCASELGTSGSGNGDCDLVASNSSIFKKIARENYPNCKTSDIKNPNDPLGCNQMDGILIHWDLYLKFYGNQIRGENDTLYGTMSLKRMYLIKQQCRNTNMIAMAIFYILQTVDKNLDLATFIRKRINTQTESDNGTTTGTTNIQPVEDSAIQAPTIQAKGGKKSKKNKRNKKYKKKQINIEIKCMFIY